MMMMDDRSYPHCLYILELLQHKEFREGCVSREFIDMLTAQQYYHWVFYRNTRILNNPDDRSGSNNNPAIANAS